MAVATLAVLGAPLLAGCGSTSAGGEPAPVAVGVAPSTVLPGATPAELAAAPTTVAPTTAAPSTAALTTAAPTTVAPTTTAPALPVPQAVPADPYAPEAEVVIGRIAIPRLGLDTDLRSGVTLTTLDKGPGHWPGTALPGDVGNVVVAGHRVTHSRPFRHLDRLEPGDDVVFTMSDGAVVTYRTVRSEVVDDEAMWIVTQTPARTATLFACHPPGSARQRFVVHLELVTT